MNDWMPKPPVRTARISARYYHLEPGDGTRYEFMVYLHPIDKGVICIAGVGGATFGHADVLLYELEEYLLRHPRWSYDRDVIDVPDKPGEVELLISHICICSGLHTNAMTAAAAIMAMNAFLQDELLL